MGWAFSLRLRVRRIVWALSPFKGTVKGTSRVYIRYIRIPGLRAHTRSAWFHPKRGLGLKKLRALRWFRLWGLGLRALGLGFRA